MASYTKSNEIMTRISLKYDSYANWTSKNPVLLKGEVAVATIPAGTATTPAMQNLPNVVMKVGDGTSQYNDLKFVSGLAADVYEWAKAPEKPSYGIGEIAGALEYRLAVVDAATYKYELQSRKANSSEAWTKVSDLDLSGIDSRLDGVEGRMTTAEGNITNLQGRMTTAEGDITSLKAAVGEAGAVSGMITGAIQALDSTQTQVAGDDGLALKVVQVDGVITEISGSIATNTYDAHGAAAAVQGETTKTVKEAWDRADAAYNLADAAQTADEVSSAINSRVQALSFAGVEGAQAGATIKFVDKISQANGIVSAELGELVFNSAYNASTNKAATMADVTSAVADLNGAMHFEGVYETLPDATNFSAGDVIIVGQTEYVLSEKDGKKSWVELGNEGAIAAALKTLSQTEVGAADKTLKVKQENGKVTATEVAIQITESQVTGLEKDLEDLGKEDERLAGLIGDNADAIDTIIGDVAGDDAKSMRAIAAEEALAKVQTLDVTDIAVGADSTLTAIGQTDGSIHATATKIQIAQTQVTGLSDALNSKLNAETFNTFKTNDFTPVKTAVDTLTGTGEGSVAKSVSDAVANLKNTDAAVDGEYVKAVKQSNGIVTVERAKLPVIPDLAITHATSATTPTETEVTVIGDLSVSGHTITDTHVKVATMAGVAAAIEALDADKTAAAKHVMTGVHQENGVIKSIDTTELADIAFSGNVADLKQTANTYIVFNCGTAEINI